MRAEYRDLVVDARDALRDLLRESEPGTGLLLHEAYNSLQAMLDEEALPARNLTSQRAEADVKSLTAECADRSARWMRQAMHEKERAIFEALRDDELPITELWRRVDALRDDWDVWHSNVASVVKRMHDRGELDRRGESRGAAIRYRYFRRTTLVGPIADLERAFTDDREGTP